MTAAEQWLGSAGIAEPRVPTIRARGSRTDRRLRVLLTTEGTYPYAMGGVSSWCDLLVRNLSEIEWQILPIVGGSMRRTPVFELPVNAVLARRVELWSEQPSGRGSRQRADRGTHFELPGVLVRNLLGWNGDLVALQDALVRCRRCPQGVRTAFRCARGWRAFLENLHAVLEERPLGAGASPQFDTLEAARLYQTLYWVARTAAVRTPPADILHVTAAGWAAIPALVDKTLYGTPLLLTEHGVYVREAYLAGIRNKQATPAARFVATRLARGLARAAYWAADVVSPVIDANARWEEGLGVDPAKIRIIYNGVSAQDPPSPPPQTKTIVSVGRIDPLKDIHTMLRVMHRVVQQVPDAQLLHYGPVTEGQEIYGRAIMRHYDRSGLLDRFCFMGRTTTPSQAVRDADIVLMTSISEGLPLAILEAMAQARPIVATGVGGVPDVVRGCGIVAPPGDVHALAQGVSTLLRAPALAAQLGQRGYARVCRLFDQRACVEAYRQLLGELADQTVAA